MDKKYKSLRYSKPSDLVKCDFCDFVSHARGIKNHLRSIHNLIATTDTVAVPDSETFQVTSTIVEDGILKTVIERVEKKKYISTYSPGCMYCMTPVTTENAKEIWEDTTTDERKFNLLDHTHRSIKSQYVLEPKAQYVCNDCEKKCRRDAAHYFKKGVIELRPIKALRKVDADGINKLHHDSMIHVHHSVLDALTKNKRGSNVATRDPDNSRLKR